MVVARTNCSRMASNRIVTYKTHDEQCRIISESEVAAHWQLITVQHRPHAAIRGSFSSFIVQFRSVNCFLNE